MLEKKLRQAISILKQGGIGVMPTDTIYGLAGSALRPRTVERIYRLRRRRANKPMILLVGSLASLQKFGIRPDRRMKKILDEFWPGPVSVIFPLSVKKPTILKKFAYLHRGGRTLACRLPQPHWLRRFLRRTGPLVVPSANLHNQPPAQNIRQAKKYFADRVDFYLSAGRRLDGQPSRLISFSNTSAKAPAPRPIPRSRGS